ncbi:MAG: polyribonucleotide nucleotidyltransferase [bacterium]|nr:polyribonucleotide nucleotidyltransferase [bacterium]
MEGFKKSIEVGGRELSFSTGVLAKQASSSILAQYGDTVILSAFVEKELRPEMKGADFVPLMIDYRERSYAAGKIPGGFFKREAKPKDSEVLVSRLIDRPLRPLFPSNIGRDLVISIVALSYDQENDTDILSLLASSLSVACTGIPFAGPVGAVRVGYIDGEFIINPKVKEKENSLLDLVVVGTEEKITMIECNASELSEEIICEAFVIAQKEVGKLVEFQKCFIAELGVEKIAPVEDIFDVKGKVSKIYADKATEIKERLLILDKLDKENALAEFKDRLKEDIDFEGIEEENYAAVTSTVFEQLIEEGFRELVLVDGKRVDGRGLEEVRKITSQVGILPGRVHGSSLFTRGETQSLGTVTLGGGRDSQILDELSGDYKKRFMLHYNFSSFSVGDIRPNRGPSRREIGHGNLAEKALEKVLPSDKDYPYAIRVVSDILESNGSSSMASVCAGCLALLHAGVPLKNPVAGISVGLVSEEDKDVLLVDIAGLEDHFGDMDFKVAGSKEGITAIQMDIKLTGIKVDLVPKVLELAKRSRIAILDKMSEVIATPNPNPSDFVPKMVKITVPQDKIKMIIGSGGANIKGLVERTGAEININDDGEVSISAVDNASFEMAKEAIEAYNKKIEVGEIYKVKVRNIMPFGAFAEVFSGTDGLIHISKIADERVEKVEDYLKEGDEVMVKVLEVNAQGKISLSIKDAK